MIGGMVLCIECIIKGGRIREYLFFLFFFPLLELVGLSPIWMESEEGGFG